MIIYCITNKITGKSYIGQTRYSIKSRLACHKSSNYLLGRAIRKYGFENFIVKSLRTYNNLEELNKAEIYFIKKYSTLSPNGYNLDSGGKEKTPSIETRQKISNSRKQDKALPLECQITYRSDNKNYRLRVYLETGRMNLGSFLTKELAIEHYNYCKKINSWVPWKNPAIDKQKNNYRLRLSNKKRTYLGTFKSFFLAFNHYKELFYGNNNY